MGTTGVLFGPIGMKLVPLEPHEGDLAQGRVPGGLGAVIIRKRKSDVNVKFAISDGHTWGTIWSYRGLSATKKAARASSCSGKGSQGAWGLLL